MPEIEYPQPQLDDGVIELRQWREGDVAAATAACQDPLITRYTRVPSPYREDDAREWIRVAEGQRLEGAGIHFIAVEAGDGALLGSAGINAITWEDRMGQIGYWVASEARRRGVATRSVRLLSRWALGSLGLARVEIRVDVENDASQRVAEGAAFVREAVLRSRAESKGRRWDEVMFSLLLTDLEGAEK